MLDVEKLGASHQCEILVAVVYHVLDDFDLSQNFSNFFNLFLYYQSSMHVFFNFLKVFCNHN